MDQALLNKIIALRSKIPENGASEEEAFAALRMADKLMAKHGFTEDDLEAVEFKRDMREGEFTQKQKAIHPSQKFCGVTIGRFCGIYIWSATINFDKKKNVRLFGMREDVEMAEFLLGMIHDSMDRGWKEFLAENPKKRVSRHTEYWSFMMGFAERINHGLTELMDARTVVTNSSGTDLVEVKHALVMKGLEVMRPDLTFKKPRKRSLSADSGSYEQGQIAGSKVNLQRPITNKSSEGTNRIGHNKI